MANRIARAHSDLALDAGRLGGEAGDEAEVVDDDRGGVGRDARRARRTSLRCPRCGARAARASLPTASSKPTVTGPNERVMRPRSSPGTLSSHSSKRRSSVSESSACALGDLAFHSSHTFVVKSSGVCVPVRASSRSTRYDDSTRAQVRQHGGDVPVGRVRRLLELNHVEALHQFVQSGDRCPQGGERVVHCSSFVAFVLSWAQAAARAAVYPLSARVVAARASTRPCRRPAW